MFMSKIGKNIRKIRKTKGLSQTEFGELFGLTRGSIGSYEEGRAEPKIDTLLLIAKRFSISVDEITTNDVTVNQLSGFNPDFVSKPIMDAKNIGIPLVSSFELLQNGGDFNSCAKIDTCSLPIIGDDVAFLIKVDVNIHIKGGQAEEGSIIICGNRNLNFENDLGCLNVGREKLVWDLGGDQVEVVYYPVYGIVSKKFKRSNLVLEQRVRFVEERLNAVEKKLLSF